MQVGADHLLPSQTAATLVTQPGEDEHAVGCCAGALIPVAQLVSSYPVVHRAGVAKAVCVASMTTHATHARARCEKRTVISLPSMYF